MPLCFTTALLNVGNSIPIAIRSQRLPVLKDLHHSFFKMPLLRNYFLATLIRIGNSSPNWHCRWGLFILNCFHLLFFQGALVKSWVSPKSTSFLFTKCSSSLDTRSSLYWKYQIFHHFGKPVSPFSENVHWEDQIGNVTLP